jgi:hypothetical protein
LRVFINEVRLRIDEGSTAMRLPPQRRAASAGLIFIEPLMTDDRFATPLPQAATAARSPEPRQCSQGVLLRDVTTSPTQALRSAERLIERTVHNRRLAASAGLSLRAFRVV